MDRVAIRDTKELLSRIGGTKEIIGFPSMVKELLDLQNKSTAADFWKNMDQAKKTLQKISSLEKEIKAWERLEDGAEKLYREERQSSDYFG